MKYKCTSQPAPPFHTTHTLTKNTLGNINTAILEAKGSDGGANWLGNRNDEGQKGTRGKRGPTLSVRTVVREWLISMSPHTHSHPRNTTCKKSNLQNKRNMAWKIMKMHITKSRKYLPNIKEISTPCWAVLSLSCPHHIARCISQISSCISLVEYYLYLI